MKTIALPFLVSASLSGFAPGTQPLEIRFDSLPGSGAVASSENFFGEASSYPSSNWESQAQPVGNGRLGAMIFGNPLKERIQFNESSLWTGGNNPSGGYDVNEFGAYQNFGEVSIEMAGGSDAGNIRSYSRCLDLSTAIHTTTWERDGTTFTREVFASKPDEAIVIRIFANQPGKVSGLVTLKGAHGEITHVSANELNIAGSLSNNLRKAACLKVLATGGSAGPSGDGIAFSGDSATLVLTAATDYSPDPAKSFRNGADPAPNAARQANAAAAINYDELRSKHVEDFRKLMGRVVLDLGPPPAGLPVDRRLDAYRKGAQDPHLEALLFQYGRYLLASSSRGFLPANLQGLWNNSNNPPWFADYHTNINIQMNYWLSGPANLAECAEPLIDWMIAMIPGSREATVKAFGEKTPGWTMRTSVNIFGGNGWQWNLPASAWLAQHVWEQYAFTGDKIFLEKTAWPTLVPICEFWLEHLVEKDGKLVVPKGWSPEHGPREDGVAHDQQIVWDLFTNTLEAAGILGRNEPVVARIRDAREKLLGPRIGSWGQIMEWTTERPELEKSEHRHTSHLFALHPGRQISLSQTPELAAAAAVSLEARGTSGDSRRSWTWPWRTAMWARLGNPAKAGEMIRGLLVHNTLPNLFTTHPPFQIDGNLGITAGVCETLLQSHAGEISILPALPPAWKNGSYSGLRARGGFEVAARWQNGSMVDASIQSIFGTKAAIRLPGNPAEVTITTPDGAKSVLKPDPNGLFHLTTTPGSTYKIRR